ncbi:MAG TPA: peptide ABC transporter substrate-binding protein [Thermomicrobiales bacterium]|nr:peptide ABC transporter substrate-binding protein [Thermomicrobiales bacterium]
MTQSGPFSRLYRQLTAGEIDRRTFLERSTALGVAGTVALFCANNASAGPSRNGFAVYQGQDGTPAASPSDASGFVLDAGTENQERGAGGDLNILQWQAPTHLMAHRASGNKDYMPADIICEPLLRYMPDATLGANLVSEVPSVENGMLAEDLSTVTFKLKEGIIWADGEPLTAKDIQFTWRWVIEPNNAAITAGTWGVISDIEVVDDLTAKVTYATPSAAWFDPFTGGNNGHIMPSHVWDDDPTKTDVSDAFMMNPVGTGPYKVDSFSPNDEGTFVLNENYREPNKPYFARIFLKGGGDAASAARAVLQTGEYDFAWNIQVEPEVAASLMAGDGPGHLVVSAGTTVERLHFNFSDPNKEVDGQRSEMNTPHPFLTDPAVREAINCAIPRQRISESLYIAGQPPTANVLEGIEMFRSPNTSWEYDLDKANAILDEAGWVLDGDVRKKDGVELHMTSATTVNSVRQKTQAVVKEELSKIGIKVDLQQVDAGIFFDSALGNDQNMRHFYWDMAEWAVNAVSSVPIGIVGEWYSGKDRSNIAQKSNGWSGGNTQRYVNDEYDAIYEKFLVANTMEEASELLIQMNDMVIGDRATVPMVNRSADTFAISNTLREENIAIGVGLEFDYWNIANWNRLPEE